MPNKSNLLICAKKNHDILKNRKQKLIDNFKRPNQKLSIKIKKRIVKHMKKECLKCNYEEFESTINTPISKKDYSIFKKGLNKILGNLADKIQKSTFKNIRNESYCTNEPSPAIYLNSLALNFDLFEYVHEISHFVLLNSNYKNWTSEVHTNILEIQIARFVFNKKLYHKYIIFKCCAYIHMLINFSFEREIYFTNKRIKSEQSLNKCYLKYLKKYFGFFSNIKNHQDFWKNDSALIHRPLESYQYLIAAEVAHTLIARPKKRSFPNNIQQFIKKELDYSEKKLKIKFQIT